MQGHDISESAPAPEPARIIDLMAALKASLGKGAGAASKAEPAAEKGDEAEAHHPRRGARRSEEAAAAEPKRAKKR